MRLSFLLLLLSVFSADAQHHDFKSDARWSYEYKQQELHYLGGQLKMKGTFIVYTTETAKLATPVGSHIFLRRNGKRRKIISYTATGLQDCDSLFNRKGEVIRVILYEKQSDELKKDSVYRPYQIKLIPFN